MTWTTSKGPLTIRVMAHKHWKTILTTTIAFVTAYPHLGSATDLDTAYTTRRVHARASSPYDVLPPVQECRAPLPQFVTKDPPSSDHPSIQAASRSLDESLGSLFNQGGLDSLAVSVVTSGGIIYEGYWGALRANETDEIKRGTVDRNTVYRLGSVSKLFTTIETLKLRDRRAFSLDDPITKILPNLTYAPNDDPITLRALLSHMSGIGRDWPPGSAVGAWPQSLNGSGPPGLNGNPFATVEQIFESIAETPLIAPPFTFPSYSDTGYELIGLANVAANKALEGDQAPTTHADLLHRDIFAPLGLNASFFTANETTDKYIAVSSSAPQESDLTLPDVINPAGGQYGSTSDVAKILQALIDPTVPGAPLRPYTIREWMRPLHIWWDDYSEVGLVWEIFNSKDSYGRTVRQYTKTGDLGSFHSTVAINPSSSFGASVLITSENAVTPQLNTIIFENFQPAFDKITEETTRQRLVGNWSSTDGQTQLSIDIISGSLFVIQYSINGTDVLQTIQSDGVSRRTALWATTVNDYRLAVSRANTGCAYQWTNLDGYAHENGYATNLIRLAQSDGEWILQLPAIGAELHRS